MRRRTFLQAALAATSTRALAAAPKITQIVLSTIRGNFHKFVAMNSYDDEPKGTSYSNTLVEISTDAGVDGIGVMGYAAPDHEFLQGVRALLGISPESLYQMSGGRITGRAPGFDGLLSKYKHLDGPLFDLIGKLRGVPCWRLLGEPVRDRIEVYDGTLYFSDLWFRDRGVSAVVAEAEEALRSGYRGMKFKLGRGWKWMDKEDGLKRDIEVVHAVRRALGDDVKILVDANNGYRGDFDRAWRLLEQTREQRLHWMEEIFPEDVTLYGRLRRRMREAGMETLIADGESVRSAQEFGPYLQPDRLVDVLQMDIRTGGFLDCLEMARIGEAAGAISVPHNWGSRVGLLMGLHLAKVTRSVVAAEDDRSTCPALVEQGYNFREGTYGVSNAPGLGLAMNLELRSLPGLFPERVVVQ
jgi:L-alanine-DL-glutamate epimerase-like enolase superfamily enzyme